MINLNPEICFKLKAARKAAKLGQTELAKEVGCKQSAISMFEQGVPQKLSEETVLKIAKRLGVDIKDEPRQAETPAISYPLPFTAASEDLLRGFCPNPRCPSNRVYEVDGTRRVMPNREVADPVGGRYCALCGEILEKRCPNCGAPVHAGAVCSICGEPYVAVG